LPARPGGTVEAIVAEVCHRLVVADKDGGELVRDAVEDVESWKAPEIVRGCRAEGMHGVAPVAPVGVRGRRSPARDPLGRAHTALGVSWPRRAAEREMCGRMATVR
jgi:hypothetical protein